MIESWLQVSVKFAQNNHFHSFSSSTHDTVVGIVSSNLLSLFFYCCYRQSPFITRCVFDINVLTIQNVEPIIDRIVWWRAILFSSCSSIIISYSHHHQGCIGMFVSVTHQSLVDPQVLLFQCRQGVVITIYFLFCMEKKKTNMKGRVHNMTPSVDLTLTRRQLNTTPWS